jgi:hypothetical protein
MTGHTTVLDLPVLLRGEPARLRCGVEELRAGQLTLYLAIIVVGAGCFGAAIGCWRAPLQAVFTAVKLPLAILLTTLGNAVLNGLLAPLFGLNLRFHQSLQAVLMSGTIACAILGAFSPLLGFMIWNTPANVLQATSSAYNAVLVTQALVIAFAGIAANARLFQLLQHYSSSRVSALKVLFGWLLGNLFLGSQLCWIMRPFVGSPELPLQFFRPDAFRGNFYEAVWYSIGRIFNQTTL